MTPEGKVKRKTDRIVKKFGSDVFWFSPLGTAYGTKAVPDRVGCAGGHFFTVEAKAPGKEPTPLQKERQRRIQRAGGTVFVLDGDREDFVIFEKWLAARAAVSGTGGCADAGA